MKKMICLLLLAVLLLAGCGTKDASPDITEASQPAADATQPASVLTDFTAFDTNSDPVKLSDYLGKPIVLNFWASWCGPCKSEMPAFQKAYEEFGDQVQFVMVNVGETTDEAEAFLAATDYTFPVLFDVNGQAAYAYQLSAIPASFFIGADGKLVYSHVGAMSESDLLEAIEKLR